MYEEIQDYVARGEAKEIFKQEAIASSKAYQETGLYLKGVEPQTWLYSWWDLKKEDPSCHE